MATIRLNNITKNYEPEGADATRAYGRVIGHATDITSRKVANAYRRDLQSAGKPPEPRRREALSHVSLEIRNGETLGILGPSGCGKTTLLKVIAGLIAPDDGIVTYDGVDMRDVSPGERRIGIVFQDYALYPHMKSQQNIGFFFKVHKRTDEIPERVRQVSKIMGIGFDRLLSRKPPTLSGGERQRVAVARCIARDPLLFLFDEPLSNLDAQLRTQTRIELKRLLDRFHTTGVYVTHDQTEAIALCDRLAIMRDGRIEQIGTFERLMEYPENTFVAEFLGTPPMNILSGHWTADGWHNKDLSWLLPPDRRHAEGQRGVLGVRPEHVTVAATLPDNEMGEAPHGRVTLIEPLISERVLLVHLQVGSTGIVARVPNTLDVRNGDNLALTFAPDRVILFDGVSGRRLD